MPLSLSICAGSRFYMHAEKCLIVRFCGREGSWLLCLYKSLNCLGGVHISMCANGAVFTGMRRQRRRKRERGRCSLQCLMITGHWLLCWCQQNCDLSGWLWCSSIYMVNVGCLYRLDCSGGLMQPPTPPLSEPEMHFSKECTCLHGFASQSLAQLLLGPAHIQAYPQRYTLYIQTQHMHMSHLLHVTLFHALADYLVFFLLKLYVVCT